VHTTLLERDVYVTDLHNARDVAVAAGRFGLTKDGGTRE